MQSVGVITGNHSAPTGLFPAKAGPTKVPHAVSGTGFSREAFGSDHSHALRGNAALDAPRPMVDAERQGMHAHAERGNDHHDQQKSQVRQLAPSRLKPVPLKHRTQPVGPASAGKPLTLIVPTLCVGMPRRTLRVLWLTRSVRGCIPTRSVGTIITITKNHGAPTGPFPAKAGPNKVPHAVSGNDHPHA